MILMVNIAGIAKYAFKTHVLTLFIMVSNFIVLVYRLTSIVYLLCRNGDEITERNAQGFYFFFFELPYHLFNVVAFLLLLNWIQACLILRFKRKDQDQISAVSRMFLERHRFNFFLTCQVTFWTFLIILDIIA